MTPRKTIAQIRAEIGFREIAPQPCCANCRHLHWDGCRLTEKTLAAPKNTRITICDRHKKDRRP